MTATRELHCVIMDPEHMALAWCVFLLVRSSSSASLLITTTVEHVRPDDSDEHIGSKKLMLSESGSLPSSAPMSADVNLSSDDMLVECFLERFERE